MFTRSTSNTPKWKNQSFNTRGLELHEGPVPDLDLPQEKNCFFVNFFAGLGGGSSLKISQWDSELLIFAKYLYSWSWSITGLEGQEQLRALCFTFVWTAKYEISMSSKSSFSMGQKVGSIVEQPEVGCLNRVLYLHVERGQQGEVMLLSVLKAGR